MKNVVKLLVLVILANIFIGCAHSVYQRKPDKAKSKKITATLYEIPFVNDSQWDKRVVLEKYGWNIVGSEIFVVKAFSDTFPTVPKGRWIVKVSALRTSNKTSNKTSVMSEMLNVRDVPYVHYKGKYYHGGYRLHD